MNRHGHLSVLRETGYVLIDPDHAEIDVSEWCGLTYQEWNVAAGIRFAPLASATGAMDCNGFWEAVPPKADKDGVWIESQRRIAPTLVRRVEAIGARAGRCRVIELQPNSYEKALENLHRDPNNRLNPDGEGWVVRSFMQLTDDPDSWMLLREGAADPVTETRIPLPAGARFIVDSERLWHSVWHTGDQPRYCVVSSLESGPTLASWIDDNRPGQAGAAESATHGRREQPRK